MNIKVVSINLCWFEKNEKKYIISKAITNAIAGGSILVAGTVAFILCTWIVFLPMEKGFFMEDYTEFFGGNMDRCCVSFLLLEHWKQKSECGFQRW